MKTNRKLYLESYGCQMNFADSGIVASIMKSAGYEVTDKVNDADVIFLNTCSVREHAESKIWNRLKHFKSRKKFNPDLVVGVLGCMAERLKTSLMETEKLVDMVVGPDAYRDLPNLVLQVEEGNKAVNVLLSRDETYADISPVRLESNGVSAFVSIMRGCDNMCSFCVVPFTRGRERSRDPESIITEARELFENGYREVTLLGQNVDSYSSQFTVHGSQLKPPAAQDLSRLRRVAITKVKDYKSFTADSEVGFADLLEMVALVHPDLRVRFSTSNPSDLTEAVLHTMAKHDNICNNIHLPVQSGNNRILDKMNRGYSREDYMQWIETIRRILPDCGISTDIITGFCSETEEEHHDTLSLMDWVGYDYAFMFKYSERPGTLAARQYADDVDEKIKTRRLNEVIDMQQKISLRSNLKDINKVHRVLAESISKRSKQHLSGRNDQNKIVIFPKENYKPGDYVNVMVTGCSSATLLGKGM